MHRVNVEMQAVLTYRIADILPASVHQAGESRGGGRAGEGQGRTDQGRVDSDPGVIMYRGRYVQLSATLQCCSCDMRPVQYQSSPATSSMNCADMSLCILPKRNTYMLRL